MNQAGNMNGSAGIEAFGIDGSGAPRHPSDSAVAVATRSEDESSAAELLERLQTGKLTCSDLSVSQRQQCVSYLSLEGFSTMEIAQVLGVGDRTIRRDRVAIRREYALSPDLALGDELLGEFQQLILHANQRLIRLARDPRIAPNSRLWAEQVIVRNYQRFIETMQRLSYLRDGTSRLKQQLDNDPVELERQAAEFNRPLRVMERANELRRPSDRQRPEFDAMIEAIISGQPQGKRSTRSERGKAGGRSRETSQ